MSAIPVSRDVFDGIEAVRTSGATNMLDRPRVIELLCDLGYVEAAAWVEAHGDLYAQAVFHGFEVTGG